MSPYIKYFLLFVCLLTLNPVWYVYADSVQSGYLIFLIPISFGLVFYLLNYNKFGYNNILSKVVYLLSNIGILFGSVLIASVLNYMISLASDSVNADNYSSLIYTIVAVGIISPVFVHFVYKIFFGFSHKNYVFYLLLAIVVIITFLIIQEFYIDFQTVSRWMTSTNLTIVIWQITMALYLQHQLNRLR